MIDREFGEYYATCDTCGMIDGPFFEFQDAVDGMKASGWKSIKIGNDWENLCPECAASYTARMRPGPSEFAGIPKPRS